jgi:phosphomannomutase
MLAQDLRTRIDQWIAADVDPKAQEELKALLSRDAAGATTDLADRFAATLEFGTAGLRGVLGAGPNRMNRAVVLRTTHGLARHLLAALGEGEARRRGVVIGFDGRHGSRVFAEDTACVLAANGVRAWLFDDEVPTPLCAFAVGHTGAAAGVMVTASHNPPEYNGYKVYWGNAAQIIPPVDVAIAKEIDAAPAARDVPRMPIAAARAEGLVVSVAPAVAEAYLARVRDLAVYDGGDRAFPIVYTALHGVGAKLARRAFDQAGFTNVAFVAEQEMPDPAFPTVAFPNPEEKGAMDLSFALGRKTQAALIVANDPDADRLAVAVPDPKAPSGFYQLTGNQVGVLLGHYLLTRGRPPLDGRFVLVSIVSSPLLGEIARELGVGYGETLTGFKWIANRAMELEAEGQRDPRVTHRFVFGYEEALGYTVGDVVRDKDGISAAVVMAELTAWLRAHGRTLQDELETIHRTYGLWISSQVNVTRPGAAGVQEIRAIMDRLRAAKPRAFGAYPVAVVRDYQAQTETHLEDGRTQPLTLPKSNVLAFELAGKSRIIARPSGTEPKIKFYFDVCERMADGEPLAAAEARAIATKNELESVFVRIAKGE